MTNGDTEPVDDRWRAWLHTELAAAADRFGVVLAGPVHWGDRLRSVSSAATGPAGDCWLRAGTEETQWTTDLVVGDCWTGIPDSASITGLPRPDVLASQEWPAPATWGDRQVRADLVTRLAGQPCSPTEALRAPVELPDHWWADLRSALNRLRATPTTRFQRRAASGGRAREVFGEKVADTYRPTARETCHGDLHWANVLGPKLGLLDWELWGSGPVGSDPATLYLFALLVPAVARRVHATFAYVLDSHAGHVAQLGVAARILARPSQHPDLAAAVRVHTDRLLGSAITT